jgi:hypothetical protein
MNYLIYILGFTLLFRLANQYRVKYFTSKMEYKLSLLRYKLISLELDNKVKKESKMYHYLYVEIANMKSGINRLSIWMMIYTIFRSNALKKNNIPIPESKLEYNPKIASDRQLKTIYDEFSGIITKYVVRKSIFSLFIIFFAKRTSARMYKWLMRLINKVKDASLATQYEYSLSYN